MFRPPTFSKRRTSGTIVTDGLPPLDLEDTAKCSSLRVGHDTDELTLKEKAPSPHQELGAGRIGLPRDEACVRHMQRPKSNVSRLGGYDPDGRCVYAAHISRSISFRPCTDPTTPTCFRSASTPFPCRTHPKRRPCFAGYSTWGSTRRARCSQSRKIRVVQGIRSVNLPTDTDRPPLKKGVPEHPPLDAAERRFSAPV